MWSRNRWCLLAATVACAGPAAVRAQADAPPPDCRSGACRTVDDILRSWRNTEKAAAPGEPAEDEARRQRRIAMVDVTGDAAVAKVELDYPGAFITDYFTLLRVDGEWRIMNKMFHVRRPGGTS